MPIVAPWNTAWCNSNTAITGSVISYYPSASYTFVGAAITSADVYNWYYNNQAVSSANCNQIHTGRIDQQVARDAELADRIEQQIARTESRATAHCRAEALLKAVLDRRQREQFECDRSFEVITSRGGRTRRYRLTSVLAGNVFLLNEAGQAIERFCIHVDERIPIPDNLVAQKFMLETDEDQFLRTANRTVPGIGNSWRPAA